jgi:hypothetical protein
MKVNPLEYPGGKMTVVVKCPFESVRSVVAFDPHVIVTFR